VVWGNNRIRLLFLLTIGFPTVINHSAANTTPFLAQHTTQLTRSFIVPKLGDLERVTFKLKLNETRGPRL
jgi:hypothetical protein